MRDGASLTSDLNNRFNNIILVNIVSVCAHRRMITNISTGRKMDVKLEQQGKRDLELDPNFFFYRRQFILPQQKTCDNNTNRSI